MTLVDCIAVHCHTITGGTLPDGEGSCGDCVEHIPHHWITMPLVVLVITIALFTIIALRRRIYAALN